MQYWSLEGKVTPKSLLSKAYYPYKICLKRSDLGGCHFAAVLAAQAMFM